MNYCLNFLIDLNLHKEHIDLDQKSHFIKNQGGNSLQRHMQSMTNLLRLFNYQNLNSNRYSIQKGVKGQIAGLLKISTYST